MSDHEKSIDSASAQSGGDEGALLSRVRLIEDQPLESRAAAFAHVHDELQTMLEGAEPRDR
ncbi:hypothetical protein [Homoserinimonas hongtaonis]|uniref:hypothetical protein n=1 Tax=Homoserinimonas hongtaonis TaxID=2079791 RepID=UPI000D3A056B|nr:hypothetical protein [Salinibacterium hongtaonis]AWB88945.1 hypothetical protein C2138_04775 [Salinibacterium hongtaonis]